MPASFINGKFGAYSGISTTNYSDGAFLVCTDTEQLFIDLNNKRIPIDSIVTGKTEQQIRGLTSAQRLPKLYLASDTYKLLWYDSTLGTPDWVYVADKANKVTETLGSANADREVLIVNADKDAVEYASAVKINPSTGRLSTNALKLGDAVVTFDSNSESLVFNFT